MPFRLTRWSFRAAFVALCVTPTIQPHSIQICFRYELVTNGPKFFTNRRVGLTKNSGFFSFVVFSCRSALRFSKSVAHT